MVSDPGVRKGIKLRGVNHWQVLCILHIYIIIYIYMHQTTPCIIVETYDYWRGCFDVRIEDGDLIVIYI